jgi:hypothetical protein
MVDIHDEEFETELNLETLLDAVTHIHHHRVQPNTLILPRDLCDRILPAERRGFNSIFGIPVIVSEELPDNEAVFISRNGSCNFVTHHARFNEGGGFEEIRRWHMDQRDGATIACSMGSNWTVTSNGPGERVVKELTDDELISLEEDDLTLEIENYEQQLDSGNIDSPML